QFNADQFGTSQPYYKIIVQLDKSIVQTARPGTKNPSANAFDICLGAKNTNYIGPTATTCTNPATSGTWKTKNGTGTCATYDSASGLYWGLVPDLKGFNKDTGCPTTGYFPGIINRSKTNAGDVQ